MRLQLSYSERNVEHPATGELVCILPTPQKKRLGKWVTVDLNEEVGRQENLLAEKWNGQESPSLPLPTVLSYSPRFPDTELGRLAKEVLKDWCLIVGARAIRQSESRFMRDRSGDTAGDYETSTTVHAIVNVWLECRIVAANQDYDWKELADLLEEWAL